MTDTESELQMVQRHVREGRKLVARQQELVAKLRANGRPTEDAQRLLANLTDLQRDHEDHLRRLMLAV